MALWLSSRNRLEAELPRDGAFWHATRHFIAGALSSALTDLCTFPLDTLKKAMQAGAVAGAASAAPAHAPPTPAVLLASGAVAPPTHVSPAVRAAEPGLRGVARRLRAEGGLARFYRGYTLRVIMISINGALFNAAFVGVKSRLEQTSASPPT